MVGGNANISLDYKYIRDQLQRIIYDYKDAKFYDCGKSQSFWMQVFNAYGVLGQMQTRAFEHRLKNEKSM